MNKVLMFIIFSCVVEFSCNVPDSELLADANSIEIRDLDYLKSIKPDNINLQSGESFKIRRSLKRGVDRLNFSLLDSNGRDLKNFDKKVINSNVYKKIYTLMSNYSIQGIWIFNDHATYSVNYGKGIYHIHYDIIFSKQFSYVKNRKDFKEGKYKEVFPNYYILY